jgi:hypothetical protein
MSIFELLITARNPKGIRIFIPTNQLFNNGK